MHLFFENAIRGGISVINHRLARANNEFVPEYNADLDKSYVALFDANNSYGWAMSKRLPTKNFKFLGKAEVESLTDDDSAKLEDEGDVGYVLEVDLFYPDELHVKHNDYPLAPESVLVTEDMLSPFCSSFGQKHTDCKKLIPNLHNKVKYMTHLKNLQLYLRLGMKLSKVHRVLTFTQTDWMRSYIEYNTEMRKLATNVFAKIFSNS